VDADDIQVAEDFNESLLHRTPEIERFLRSDRDDKFIVIGTNARATGQNLCAEVVRSTQEAWPWRDRQPRVEYLLHPQRASCGTRCGGCAYDELRSRSTAYAQSFLIAPSGA
jgi:hypothetical protein